MSGLIHHPVKRMALRGVLRRRSPSARRNVVKTTPVARVVSTHLVLVVAGRSLFASINPWFLIGGQAA